MKNFLSNNYAIRSCAAILALFSINGWGSGEVPEATNRCSYLLERSGDKKNLLPEWWFTDTAPLPKSSAIDPERYERWLAAQPREYDFIFDFVRKHLREISHEAFEAALVKSFEVFLEHRSGRPLIFVTFHWHFTKSSTWALHLLREHFPEIMLKSDYVVGENTRGFGPTDLEKMASGEYEIVLVDDATYKGNERNQIAQILAMAQLSVSRPLREISVVCAYATAAAREFFPLDHQGSSPPIPSAKLWATGNIPTVGELLAQSPDTMNALQNQRHRMDWARILWNQDVLTVFAHHRPDGLPPMLRAGFVYSVSPEGPIDIPNTSIPFIKDLVPYREVRPTDPFF